MNEISKEKSKIHRGVIVYSSIINVSTLGPTSNCHEDRKDSKYIFDRQK